MFYVVAPNGVFSRVVPQYGNQHWDDTHFCQPSALTTQEAVIFGVSPLTETQKPAYNPVTEEVSEIDPEFSGGAWRQKWVVSALPAEQVQANLAAAEASRIAALWQAAHNYEFAQISGSAIGLLALGVIAGKPKCLAVQNWIKSIWTLYYARKADGSTSTDFSSCGQIPHTVPDLMVELGV